MLARRVRENSLGLLFPSGDADALYAAMRKISTSDMRQYRTFAAIYADSCSRNAFRESLLKQCKV
ncbi:MAG: glycosyltransferase family 4 protein [Desulfobacteraceae bacterium]|nr:glycosyltransferase family 4 protein [Desulfobacteraceae bacterium]